MLYIGNHLDTELPSILVNMIQKMQQAIGGLSKQSENVAHFSFPCGFLFYRRKR